MGRILLLAAAVAMGTGMVATIAPSASAEESCSVTGPVMSKEAMQKSLTERGYTQIRSLREHRGCYEAKGIDQNGKRFEIEVNGATGAVQNVE